MKAVVYKSYGPPEVLMIEEIEKPIPKENEVLVKVYATSVNPVEWYTMTGLFLARIGNGLFKPKDTRLGTDYAGVVEAVGKDVTDFKPGDEVYGGRSGAFAARPPYPNSRPFSTYVIRWSSVKGLLPKSMSGKC